MNSSVVGAPGAGGHRLRLPQRAAAIVTTANSKTAIARVADASCHGPSGERELEIGHRATYGVGACCGWRKRINGGRNTSGSVLIAIGRKAKRASRPRSHVAPLSTDTSRAWV